MAMKAEREITIEVGGVRSVAELYALMEKALGIRLGSYNANALYDILSTAGFLGTVRLVSSQGLEQAIGTVDFRLIVQAFENASANFRDHGLPHRLTLRLE